MSRKTFLSNTLVSLKKATTGVEMPPQEVLIEGGQTLLPLQVSPGP